MEDDQSATIAFLSTPQAYGLHGVAVERHSTHGSIVFLAGDKAYKLKRAVRFPYMDYSTLARRKAMCEAELAVNRRLAPELYIETLPVLRGSAGAYRLGPAQASEAAVDWLVVMRRFRQDALLEAVCARGGLTAPLMRGLAERVAAFHADAEPTSAFGGARGIAAVIEENIEMLGGMAGRPFQRDAIARWTSLARDALARRKAHLDARRDDGHVRRCHGDLHLNNVCLLDGRPVPFDAIEFRDDFACIDVLFDLALLLIDVDRHGLRALANALLNRYLERSGDYAGLAALPLFLSCRAAMRAHVTVSMAQAEPGGLTSSRADAARHLLDMAVSYLEPAPVRLIAVGGPSGTGKSTLATAMAPAIGRAPGAVVIRSDIVRKQSCGVGELSRLPQAAYAEDVTARVYAEVERRAALVLAGGYCAIVDAVCGRAEQRAGIAALARANGAALHGLWLDAAADVLERRLRDRRGDASDADVAVLHAQLFEIERPDDWTAIDAGGTPAQIVARALHALGPNDAAAAPA